MDTFSQILFGFKPACSANSVEMSQTTAEYVKVMYVGLEISQTYITNAEWGFRNQPWKRGTMVQKEGPQSQKSILNDC